jgi:hypothetical protein
MWKEVKENTAGRKNKRKVLKFTENSPDFNDALGRQIASVFRLKFDSELSKRWGQDDSCIRAALAATLVRGT